MRQFYVPTFFAVMILFSICTSCEKTTPTLINKEELVNFRGGFIDQSEWIRPRVSPRDSYYYRTGDNPGPVFGLPEGSLGCWAGNWEGSWLPNSGDDILLSMHMQYKGTYHADLDGSDGDWQILGANGIIYQGHFQVYTYSPYADGTSALFLRLMESDGTVWATGPWWGVLNKDCNIIQGPTLTGTQETGYYYMTKVN